MTRLESAEGHTPLWAGVHLTEHAPDRERVRAVIVDDDGALVLFRRAVPGRELYWTTPGGGVEDGETLLQALERELDEELRAVVAHPLLLISVDRVHDGNGLLNRHYIFGCRLVGMRPEERHGPEFHPGNGVHDVVRVPLTAEALTEINLVPPELRRVLIEHADAVRRRFVPADVRPPVTPTA